MSRKKASIFAVILPFLLVSQSVAKEPKAGQPKTQAGREGGTARLLQITAHTDQHVTGFLMRDSLYVHFSAEMGTPSRAILRLELGDVALDAEADFDNDTRTLDGHGHALSLDQHLALLNLHAELVRNLDQFEPQALGHEDLLFRVVSYWAEAPVGWPLSYRVISRPNPEMFPAPSATPRFACQTGYESESDVLSDCVNCGDEPSCGCESETRIDYLTYGCACAPYTLWHDAGNHCFCQETVVAGCDSNGECLGECGPGCIGVGVGNVYTIDCAEHDRCCRVHGGCLDAFDVECGDEWVDAADDTLFGLFIDCNGNCGSENPFLVPAGTSLQPNVVEPGDQITLYYAVSNPSPVPHGLFLGASIRRTSGGPFINSVDCEGCGSDSLVAIQGDVDQLFSRCFTLPASLTPGLYEVCYAIWDPSNCGPGIQYDSFCRNDLIINPLPCDEQCTPWVAGACGAGPCAPQERRFTRSCPAGCGPVQDCVFDPSCVPPPEEGEPSDCTEPGYEFCRAFSFENCDVAIALNLYDNINNIEWGAVVDSSDPYVIGEYRIGWTAVDAEHVYYDCDCNSNCSNSCEYGGCNCEEISLTGMRVTVVAPGMAHHDGVQAYDDTPDWACWTGFNAFNPSYNNGADPIYVLRCFDDGDCGSQQYCDKSGSWSSWECVDKQPDGVSCSDDSECLSGYCDNDGVGAGDDGWCFTPLATYFDGQEPGHCEYSTGAGTTLCDERLVGEELDVCIGVPYREERCSDTCTGQDITDVFECNDAGCVCDEPLCDGLTEGSDIPSCASELPYFADRCTAIARGEDRGDFVCRSAAFAPGCTGDPECDGTVAGTGNCSLTCQYCGDTPCDDGLFCNGVEYCGPDGNCVAGVDPCPGMLCRESDDTCVECLSNPDCDDGQFCNGDETCDGNGSCQPGGDPCPGLLCDEVNDECVDCLSNADCNDGQFCNGGECVACSSNADCNDGDPCTADSCVGSECQNTPSLSCCGDGSCDGDETCETCPQDCDGGCGDGCCLGSESCEACPQDCDACPGACCLPDETCELLTESDCLSMAGEFRGDPSCPLSAPCVCEADYVVNAPYTSPVRNTCGAGNDCNLRPSQEHVYQVTIPEPGEWMISLCDDATALDTYLYIGTTCCGQDIASNDDSCTVQSEIVIDSLDAGVYYITIEAWSPSYCDTYRLSILRPPLGACCLDNGHTCQTDLTRINCQNQGGVWQGADSTNCSGCEPSGACCIGNTCVLLVTEAFCMDQNGVWHGEGASSCTNCPPPMGACCFDGAACQADTAQTDCEALGGDWAGADAVCGDCSATCGDDLCNGDETCETCPEDCGDCTTWYRDKDGDGWGDPDDSIESESKPDGYVGDRADCNDNLASVNPGADEICDNGRDDDCDGRVDFDDGDCVDCETSICGFCLVPIPAALLVLGICGMRLGLRQRRRWG